MVDEIFFGCIFVDKMVGRFFPGKLVDLMVGSDLCELLMAGCI